MRYYHLVWATLWRKPVRTILTTLSITAAFVLVGILGGVYSSYSALISASRYDRLTVDPKFQTPLPISYLAQIQQVPGVKVVAPNAGVPAFYQDQKNKLMMFGTDSRWFQTRPEVKVTSAMLQSYENLRTAAIVTERAAAKYGWKIGDKIPVQSPIPRADGSTLWTLDLVGIVNDAPAGLPEFAILTNYNYVDDSRAVAKGTVGRFLVIIDDGNRATSVSRQIDDLFSNSAAATQTRPEVLGVKGGLGEIFDVQFFVQAVVGSALFMLLFLTSNVMMQSVREQIPEFAVLRTIGFSDRNIFAFVLSESTIQCLVGAMIGLAIAWSMSSWVTSAFEVNPVLAPNVSISVVALGVVIAVSVALISAAVPAWSAKSINVVQALMGR